MICVEDPSLLESWVQSAVSAMLSQKKVKGLVPGASSGTAVDIAVDTNITFLLFIGFMKRLHPELFIDLTRLV